MNQWAADRSSEHGLGRFALMSIVLSAGLVVFVTISSVGIFPAGVRSNVGHLFPEGWELFAEPPAAPRFRAAVFRDGRWKDATRLPLAKPSNAFGLNRSVRWQAVEFNRLVAEVPRLESWATCERRPFRCLAEAERRGEVRRVRNRTPFQTVCGRAGLVRELIQPPGAGDPFEITHVVVLDVQC